MVVSQSYYSENIYNDNIWWIPYKWILEQIHLSNMVKLCYLSVWLCFSELSFHTNIFEYDFCFHFFNLYPSNSLNLFLSDLNNRFLSSSLLQINISLIYYTNVSFFSYSILFSFTFWLKSPEVYFSHNASKIN